ncbi:patatin-like phospholipase family protein [Propionicimonas sp.]|uniref:patatin-like phospholipase family protein n=2 Tax=Propionicimonas sp. TaxID=1955623 RepID=UPI00184F5E02|nr:patatin-like phospholipase family protein [Propionicimonas sp.]MBU3975912.1 patatin-like phospholipase family protein [Actinomycetota bacterium]MBA3020729.1 hypothetical protein [Propionicimonas sp.]MBU3985102.1 patatin-like phospholipase family protein [Actinomycetota bacterium]MBU4008092.1 patatin-like phospholipase family protein [Actinomycetota bacterium]MBU4064694.1 patatin-like phospholipase family protein [Actinomycetota bacterium]
MNATPEPDPFPLHPEAACNLIMKGGIASGVIYPRLISELARSYRFSAIGGTSAGAIAAAGAAVAELRRQRDHDTAGFEALTRLPEELAKPSGRGNVLLSLFHPEPETAPLFKVLVALLSSPHTSPLGRGAAVLGTLFTSYGLRASLGAAPGLTLAAWGAAIGGQAIGVGLIGGLTLALAGALLGAASGIWNTLTKKTPQNRFGLCSGRGGTPEAPALTDWAHAYLQTLAGLDAEADPITFGDLAAQGVTLRMMTTNLSQRRPMAMPWAETGYYFPLAEWQRLFPPSVIEWLTRPANAPAWAADSRRDPLSQSLAQRAAAAGLHPLPDGDRLPLIVAVRLSLSTPVLISAVPLATIPWGNGDDTFVTNWFADGGLCTNLPVHFFDRPLATLPTFAINLQEVAEPITHADDATCLPQGNHEGLLRTVHSWEAADAGALGRFLNSVLMTWQTWVDNEALRQPGYRDRVATVFTTAEEGGFNLNMDAQTVASLAERGRDAGAKLVAKFTGPFGESPVPVTGFDNHRWIRLRSALAGLGEWLDEFNDAFDAPSPGAIPHADLLRLPGDDLPSYRDNLRATRKFAHQVHDLAHAADLTRLSGGAPRPRPRLRLIPYDRAAAELPPQEVQSEDVPDSSHPTDVS